MMVSGQIERDLIGVNRGMLHEVDDQLDIMKTVTKFARRAMDPAEVPDTVHEAFHHLKNGRPRVPWKSRSRRKPWPRSADVELFEPEAPRPAGSRLRKNRGGGPHAGSRGKSAHLGRRRGTISSEASAAVRKLAEHLQMPVIATAEAKGIISDRHPTVAGLALAPQ